MIVKRCVSGYRETDRRLSDAIERRGLRVFGVIDHAAAAREAGLELADEEVVLFGNPRRARRFMQSDPRIGIELPLRMVGLGGRRRRCARLPGSAWACRRLRRRAA